MPNQPDFNQMFAQMNGGTNQKKKGPSYSLYLNDKHISHVNFNASVPREVSDKVVEAITNSVAVLTAKFNDGTSVATYDLAGL